MTRRLSQSSALTKWSLAALLLGLGLGAVGHTTGLAAFGAIGEAARAVGALWISAMQMIALPLVIVLLLSALTGTSSSAMGRLGLRAALVYALFLVGAAGVSLTVTSLLLARYHVDATTVAAMRAPTLMPAAVANATPFSLGTWFSQLLPRNVFEAASTGQMFPIVVFTLLFALAVSQSPAEPRRMLADCFRALVGPMMVLVHWLLVVTPIGVFALSYSLALTGGSTLARALGVYLLLAPGVVLLVAVLLYPVAVLIGRTTLHRFAKAVAPAQIVAVTTRSSMAALPALLEGSRREMDWTPGTGEVVLPLTVSLFRISEAIANPVKLLFLAHVFGIALDPGAIGSFIVTVILFSVGGSGTPNSGGGIGFRMVPVFMAAGIPVGGVMLLEAVETIPDVFNTLVNVTGQMTAATILARKPV